MTITANATVTFRYVNSKKVTKIKTGTVDPRYLPDDRGEMLVRIAGKLYCCNVSDVIEVK